MTDAAKAARAAYRREWAKKNPDKIKEYAERHWTKKAKEAEQSAKKGDKKNASTKD